MPLLENYQAFNGRHWETGSVANYYAYRGVKAPHTGQPYSEALLMGISGGVVMGYFTFAYEGIDPQARVLTRNTFDPLDKLFTRLGIVQNIHQTSKPEKAVRNLVETLASGVPAIVWADAYSLPYNALPYAEGGMWWMAPTLVYGYDEAADTVWIAGGAGVPLTVTTEELMRARGKVKQDKYRLLTLEAPKEEKLATAVQQGLWDCIKLFTEKPPKGGKNSFGFAAYKAWIEYLTKPKSRLSWEREFPAGPKMYAGLKSLFVDICTFGTDGKAERPLYGAFLEEASQILSKPGLAECAALFRESGELWQALSVALLPDHIVPFQRTRELLLLKRDLFVAHGGAAQAKIQAINAELQEMKATIAQTFPIANEVVPAFRQTLADHILPIMNLEQQAITCLQAMLS